MQMLAKQHQVYVIAGTIPLKCPDADGVQHHRWFTHPMARWWRATTKSTCLALITVWRSYDEARTIYAGDTAQAPVVWTPWGKIGLSICYDVRFPELYRAARSVIAWVNVAAFTFTTGQAHWELLMRTRAVENQCYVVACGQGGRHDNGRQTFGHSMIIDPWGVVQAVRETGEGVIATLIKLSRIERVRSSIPALSHRVL